MTASVSPRNPSALDALGEAVAHMRAKLFPFSFGGWIVLAFVSLIESCASSGGGPGGPGGGFGGPGSPGGGPGPFGDPGQMMEQAFAWVAAHMLVLIAILLVFMLISLVFLWLRARMNFVYIDDVASGRFDLSRPWSQHGAHADSFFAVSLIVQGVAFVWLVLLLALGVFFIIWSRAHDLGMGAVALGAIPLAFIFFISILVASLINLALRDFVAPLQLSRDIGAREACSVFWSMVAGRPSLFIVYALLKFLVGIAISMAVFLVGCLTCCIGWLPMVNQMLFQPVYYTERAWSLKLLAQMGDDVASKLMPAPAVPAYYSDSDAPTGPIDLSQIDFEN